MMTVGITGATGFVGKRFIAVNEGRYRLLQLPLRTVSPAAMDLSGVDVIVHLAGKAHQMEPIEDKIYFDVNYELTKQLALRALEQGVKQFIYISSTKVYGDDIKETLNESSPCHPDDAYGASKLKAEEFVLSLNAPGFTVAVLRPPVVYGPEVKGNIIRLLHLSDKSYPLPFGRSGNARSMVYVDNLVALIDRIIGKNASGVFVAGDAKPLATDELIGMIRKQLGKPKRLVSVPGPLRSMIKMVKPALYTRLFGSFVVDNTSTNRRLDFTPPYSSEQGIAEMVRWFRQTNG